MDPSREEIAQGAEAIGQALMELSSADANPGSRIHRALADRILGGVWGSRPQLDAYGLAQRLTFHAGDHLVGIAAALRNPRVNYSIQSLARPCVESAARAVFLLDSTIDQRERVRRWINENLDDLMEGSRLASGIDNDAAKEAGAQRLQAVRAIVDEAAARGFDVVNGNLIPGNKGWISTPFLRPPRPTAQAVIGILDRVPGSGATAHRLASGAIHASDHALLSIAGRDQAVDGGGPGMIRVPVGASPVQLAIWVAPTITGAESAAQLLSSALGRDPAEWNAIALPVLTMWHGWMSEFKDSPDPPSGI